VAAVGNVIDGKIRPTSLADHEEVASIMQCLVRSD
jgi:hypothetical protein